MFVLFDPFLATLGSAVLFLRCSNIIVMRDRARSLSQEGPNPSSALVYFLFVGRYYNNAKLAEVGRVIIPTVGRGVFSSTLGDAAPLPSPTLIFVVFLVGMKVTSLHLLLLRWARQFCILAPFVGTHDDSGRWWRQLAYPRAADRIRRRRMVDGGWRWMICYVVHG